MSDRNEYEWSTQFPFAPSWAGEATLLLKSLPAQVCGRVISVLPTLAWLMICGIVPLLLASVCGLKTPESDVVNIFLVFVVPPTIYSAIVFVRVCIRLAQRRYRCDENFVLVILDEATFLGWGITVAVMQMFRPLNLFFTVPLRLVFSSPRAIRWMIFILVLASLLVIGWSLLPVKFVPWANQYGRGVVASVSVGGIFAMATITLIGLLLLIVIFFGFWAEMLALGGAVVFAAVMMSTELPSSLTWVFDPLIAWSQWMPAGMRPILHAGHDLHPYLTGPGNVTPFGLLSISIVLHGIPYAMKKLNVKLLPGEYTIAAEDRQEIDNGTGWWLRAVAVVVFFELPLVLVLLGYSTALADPSLPPVGNGPFVMLCALGVLGCFLLYRMLRTRSRTIERPSDFAKSLTVYMQRCLG